jgi:phosphohistidine phosphatase
MKTCLLMRHAKSSWKDLTLPDHDRPLKRRGKRDAPRIGTLLMDQNLIPDTILCSTAKRAHQTVDGLLQNCDFEGELNYLEELYHADYGTYLEVLSRLPNWIETAMIVGHNPEMDEFLEDVCAVYDHMVTAAIALIQFPVDDWAELSPESQGDLLQLWRPREID